MRKFLLFGLALAALAGCKTRTLAPYVSPCVRGRVIAADTGLPLANVQVTRGRPPEDSGSTLPPKGGELLIRKAPERTDRNGEFWFSSERALTPLPWAGWHSVQLSFECAGYERFRTNYAITVAATNSPTGEPLVNAGDIALRPASKGGEHLTNP